MKKEVRQSGNKPSNECSLQGCNSTHITLKLTTFKDVGDLDRHAQFCSDAHAATWIISYGIRELAGWKDGVPTQRVVDEIEGIIEEMMEDPDLRD